MDYKKGKIVEEIIYDLQKALGEHYPNEVIKQEDVPRFLRILLEKAREVIGE